MHAPTASGLLLLPALLLAGMAPLSAQDSARQQSHEHADQARHADADQGVQGGGSIPAGWTARADEGAGIANVKVVPMGKGMHVTLGPAVILYKEKGGSGPFHTLATFTQTKKAAHAEGYGLFFGGQALDGASEKYTYFLVRQDGTYLVKHRDGAKTTEVTKGWVASPAVKQVGAQGAATNLLEIDAKSEPGRVTYKVNGQSVYTQEAKAADLSGVVGLRVNHNLDLHIDGFDVHR